MADTLTKERRSWNMGRISGKNTRPELLVRRLLHSLGYRFTINGPSNRNLPGRPDIVLPKYRTAMFVHGCFWHRHVGCRDTTTPKSRTGWWLKKFKGNVSRDRVAQSLLRKLGWSVIVVWECETNTPGRIKMLRTELAQRLRHRGKTYASV